MSWRVLVHTFDVEKTTGAWYVSSYANTADHDYGNVVENGVGHP